jgi:hypothetical protein
MRAVSDADQVLWLVGKAMFRGRGRDLEFRNIIWADQLGSVPARAWY